MRVAYAVPYSAVECYQRLVKLTQSPVIIKKQQFDFLTSSFQQTWDGGCQFFLSAVRGKDKIRAQVSGEFKPDGASATRAEFRITIPTTHWGSVVVGFLFGLLILLSLIIVQHGSAMLLSGGLALCLLSVAMAVEGRLNQRRLAYLLADALDQPVKPPRLGVYSLFIWLTLTMLASWLISLGLMVMGRSLPLLAGPGIALGITLLFVLFLGYVVGSGTIALMLIHRAVGQLRFARALKLIRIFSHLTPHERMGMPMYTHMRIWILILDYRYDEAEAAIYQWLQSKRMLKVGADCSIPLMLLGLIGLNRGDFAAARHWLGQSLQHNPKQPATHIIWAELVLHEGGQAQQALAELDIFEQTGLNRSWLGRRVFPQTHQLTIQAYRAWAYAQLGDAERVSQLIEEALQPNPSYTSRPGEAEIHFFVGMALHTIGRRDEARSQWEQAVALNPRGHAGRKAQQYLSETSL